MKYVNLKMRFKLKNIIQNKIVKLKNISILEETNKVYIFKMDNSFGLIDLSLRNIISFNFEKCSFFREGFLVFSKNNRYGWINQKGEILLYGFDFCYDFQEGIGMFRNNNKWGWINSEGKIIGKGFDYCYNFKDGFGRFEKNKEIFWMDKNGEIYIKNPY